MKPKIVTHPRSGRVLCPYVPCLVRTEEVPAYLSLRSALHCLPVKQTSFVG